MKWTFLVLMLGISLFAQAKVNINFSNSSLKTNAQGTFDIGTPVYDSTDKIWLPGHQPNGAGEVITPAGTWCMAFKGAFEGFQMGIDKEVTFLGHPSIFYSFGPTCAGCVYGCTPTNPCEAGVAGHGADRAIHQSPSQDCHIGGSNYDGTPPKWGMGMKANVPVYIGMAIYIASKEWGFDSTSSPPIVFELFQPDLLLTIGNKDLSSIWMEGYPQYPVPFTADAWNYFVIGMNANRVTPTQSFASMWKVTPNPSTGSWLKDSVAVQFINIQNYPYPQGSSWTFNWGIYRGKKKVSQKIRFGEINIGNTFEEAMPQP